MLVSEISFSQDIEIRFFNTQDSIWLSGTLSTPDTANKHPVVVLISGAGGQDRDYQFGNYSLFKMLSDSLNKLGLAVLRYDDRGIGFSEGNHEIATTYDFSKDLEAAVDYVYKLNFIDSSKIGLIGHSEGGFIAPLLASRDRRIDFIISMAGPGETLRKVLSKQLYDINLYLGMKTYVAKKYGELRDSTICLLSKDTSAYTKESITKYIDHEVYQFNSLNEDSLSNIPIDLWIEEFSKPWYRYLLNLDPIEVWENISCQSLILNGTFDKQVDFNANALRIKEYTSPEKVQVVLIEGANHLFQPTAELFDNNLGMDENTYKIIKDWLSKHGFIHY